MRRWTDKELAALKQLHTKYTVKELAEITGRTETAIKVKAVRTGNIYTKIEKNEHYFDEINNPDKAYWLGFITADGYVCNDPEKRQYMLGIELSSVDKQHLEKFKEALGSESKIVTRKRQTFKDRGKTYEECSVRIYSKKLIEGLDRLGICKDKTHHMDDIRIPTEYFWDYIRGYFDGDGSLSMSKVTRENGRIDCYPRISFTCLQKSFLERIKTILDSFSIDSKIYTDRGRNWSLQIRRVDSVNMFLKNMYSDSPSTFLTRKYEKYLHLTSK